MLDCDGTLVDTLGDFDAALNAMLRQMRRPRIEREQIARFVGRGTEHLLRCVLALQDGGAMPDEATFNQAWAAYLQAYEQVNGTHSRLYPGVREGLAALQAQGLPLACLTNKPQAFARELMRRLGLAPFFRSAGSEKRQPWAPCRWGGWGRAPMPTDACRVLPETGMTACG